MVGPELQGRGAQGTRESPYLGAAALHGFPLVRLPHTGSHGVNSGAAGGALQRGCPGLPLAWLRGLLPHTLGPGPDPLGRLPPVWDRQVPKAQEPQHSPQQAVQLSDIHMSPVGRADGSVQQLRQAERCHRCGCARQRESDPRAAQTAGSRRPSSCLAAPPAALHRTCRGN